jgi:RNA-directed DNA polymerase
MSSQRKTKKFFEGITWDKVVWKESYNNVRSIQTRIFKASQKNNRRVVWFLQKLLTRNPHAKLVAVHQVTTLNKGKTTPGIDGYVATTNEQKLNLARNLELNGKAITIRRVWIPKPGKLEKRPLGIPTIRDRAKQALCKLALEPEWEAKFEPNSYGFRPGRSTHDAIGAIFLNLHHQTDKYVYDADIRKCFDRINHEYLLNKLETFPLFQNQIRSWLKAGIIEEYANETKTSIPSMGCPQGGIISPLLANIALHGLEEHLLEFVSTREMSKPHPNSSRGKRAKRSALGVIRYADDFVIIHRNLEILNKVICEVDRWLLKAGLEIADGKTKLRKASQSFQFLGFQIILVKRNGQYRTKISPAKKNMINLTQNTHKIIQNNRSASSYKLISLLRPVIIGWGNYFQYCECKIAFSKLDNVIYHQLRAWVFRRAIRIGRTKVRDKYFPTGRTYIYQGRSYKANWVLTGLESNGENRKPRTNYLPKLSWIQSTNYIKVQGSRSIYDGNDIYWTLRTDKNTILSTRVKNLLRKQKGYCNMCNTKFTSEDQIEVDHIIPLSQNGKDEYKNLQLLHRECHVRKTKNDLQVKAKMSMQEPDEGKSFTSGSEDEDRL